MSSIGEQLILLAGRITEQFAPSTWLKLPKCFLELHGPNKEWRPAADGSFGSVKRGRQGSSFGVKMRRITLEMATQEYDMIFVGGGLAALLLLRELRTALPGMVAVVDPSSLIGRTSVHWGYLSHEQTPYDRFAVVSGARVADMPPEPIAPFCLRLVRSTDVFSHVGESLSSTSVQWLQTTARSITSRSDGLYEIAHPASLPGVRQRPRPRLPFAA